MIRFSICLIEDDDEDQAREILGPDARLERQGATLFGKAETAHIEAFGEAGLLVTVLPDIEQGAVTAAPVPTVNPLADFDEVESNLDLPMPGTFGTVSISGPLTEERQGWMKQNGLEIRSRLEPSRYVVRVDRSQWDGLGPGWLTTGDYGLAETVGETFFASEIENFEGGEIAFEADPANLPQADEGPAPSAIAGVRGAESSASALAAGSSAFLGGSNIGDSLGASEPSIYDARCHTPHTPAALKAILERDPRVISVEAGESRVRVTVNDPDETFFGDLAGLEIVAQAEPYIPFSLELTYAVAVVRGGQPHPTVLPWKGAGETIGIADSGVDAQHPDLIGRATVKLFAQPPSDRDPHGHGTHVASIAAGTGAASNGELAGMAPEAKIYVQSLMNSEWKLDFGRDGIAPLLEDAFAAGVRVQNFSFGAAAKGRYTIDSRELDAFVYAHEDMLVVVASGNDGEQDPGNAAKRAGLNSLASPASAKNCLTVGASGTPRTDGPYVDQPWSAYDGKRPPQFPPMSDCHIIGDAGIVAPLSSRGPTREGRLKPELVAPGVCIAAARSADSSPTHPVVGFSDHYCYFTGTSMAAPLVAGAAAVLRQYLRQERGHQPTAALLKACLINSAHWLAGDDWEDPDIGEPNFHQGFGLVSLARTIPTEGAGFSLLFDDIRNGDEQALSSRGDARWTRAFTVAEGYPLSCTLAWTDLEARGLQSDLELALIDPTGARYVANAGLRRAPYEQRDTRNNVKRIVVAEPAAGEWRAVVVANDVYRTQGFALAITGIITE